jgi:TonB family protein
VPPGTPVAVAVDVPAPVVSSTAAAPQYDALPVAHDDMIYTTTDAAVIPPVLVRPVLPKYPPPSLAEDQIGSIEVLVDEQGDVDQVRLISPANRFHERMLMSAAKTWKFRPAFKDGHPVRYRTRIRVTL